MQQRYPSASSSVLAGLETPYQQQMPAGQRSTVSLEEASIDVLRDALMRQAEQIKHLRSELRHCSDLRRYTTLYLGCTQPAFLVPVEAGASAEQALRTLRDSAARCMGSEVRLYRLGPLGGWEPLDCAGEATSLTRDPRWRVIAVRKTTPGEQLARAIAVLEPAAPDPTAEPAPPPSSSSSSSSSSSAAAGGSGSDQSPLAPSSSAPTPSAHAGRPSPGSAPAAGRAFLSPDEGAQGPPKRPRLRATDGLPDGVRLVSAPGGDRFSATLRLSVRIFGGPATARRAPGRVLQSRWEDVCFGVGDDFERPEAAAQALDRALLCANGAASAVLRRAEAEAQRAVERAFSAPADAARAERAVRAVSVELLLVPGGPDGRAQAAAPGSFCPLLAEACRGRAAASPGEEPAPPRLLHRSVLLDQGVLDGDLHSVVRGDLRAEAAAEAHRLLHDALGRAMPGLVAAITALGTVRARQNGPVTWAAPPAPGVPGGQVLASNRTDLLIRAAAVVSSRGSSRARSAAARTPAGPRMAAFPDAGGDGGGAGWLGLTARGGSVPAGDGDGQGPGVRAPRSAASERGDATSADEDDEDDEDDDGVGSRTSSRRRSKRRRPARLAPPSLDPAARPKAEPRRQAAKATPSGSRAAASAPGAAASSSAPAGTPGSASRPVRKLVKTSQYRGVRFCKKSLKWVASISHKSKVTRLGVFTSEDEAARAYDAAAYAIIAKQPDVPPRHQPKPNFDGAGNRIPYSRRTRRHEKVQVEDIAQVIRTRKAQA